ncbi:MAG: hypothetical protein FWE14_01060 [Lachnospiraceae bacterium]|nr:hypothetical protein [Lachnospiraceae bacterium]
MPIITKLIWIFAIVITFISLLWFLVGTTAFFQRGIDLETSFLYIFLWLPALLFIAVSIFALKKGWMPNHIYAQINLILVILFLTIVFSINLIKGVNPKGWLEERIFSDYIQITFDDKYEYQLELINPFQKNSYTQLYIKNISSGEEIRIPIDIQTKDIRESFHLSSDPRKVPSVKEWVWSEMENGNKENIYILTITEGFKREGKIEVFEIDMELRKSQRIE